MSEQSKSLQNIGKRAYKSIADMVAALECDYEALLTYCCCFYFGEG